MKSLAVAKLTFSESVKERFFLGVVGADVLFCVLSYFLSEISAGDNVKIAMDFILAFQFFAAAIYSTLAVVGSFQKDLHQKVIYLIYSKPITRGQYLWGKVLGFSALFFVLSFLLTLINGVAILAINWISNLIFPHLVLTERLFLFGLALFFMLFLLSSVSTLTSLLFSNPSMAAFAALLVFVAGLELSPVREIASSATFVSEFNRRLIEVVYYLFPNFSLFDVKAFVVHTLYREMSPIYFFLIALYSLVYGGALLFLSTIIFERREL